MSSSSIRKGLDDYQELTRRLSSSIGEAAVDWQDEVYSSLQTQVAAVASASRQVMDAGMRTYEALARFERILGEG